MKELKGYFKLIFGSFIIGASLNLFFMNYNLIPANLFGFGVLISSKGCMELGTATFLINLLFILIGYLTIPTKYIKKVIIPLILIPIFIYLTKNIGLIVDISSADTLLIAAFGGLAIGFGSSFIYKENRFVGGADIIEKISKTISEQNSKVVIYIIDVIVLLFTILNYGFEMAMYSAVAVIIIEIMNKRSTIGISDDKIFYIITDREQEVKRFIINELHYDLTIFDVKGGFSKNKNKVLMSAIPTKDYYKLKEGIKNIDPKAFISITDSYEVINENVSLNR